MIDIGLIPLRIGSKGIPKKNIRSFAGKPLFYWVTRSALDSSQFKRIFISTDSVEIESQVKALFGDSVFIDHRPPGLSGDISSTDSVLCEFFQRHPCNTFAIIQATSPLLQASHVTSAVRFFNEMGYDSLLTVCEFKRFLWSFDGRPLNYNPSDRPRRQDFKGSLLENGALYVGKTYGLLETKCRLFGHIGTFTLPDELSIELDSEFDWHVAEQVLFHANRTAMLPNR